MNRDAGLEHLEYMTIFCNSTKNSLVHFLSQQFISPFRQHYRQFKLSTKVDGQKSFSLVPVNV